MKLKQQRQIFAKIVPCHYLVRQVSFAPLAYYCFGFSLHRLITTQKKVVYAWLDRKHACAEASVNVLNEVTTRTALY